MSVTMPMIAHHLVGIEQDLVDEEDESVPNDEEGKRQRERFVTVTMSKCMIMIIVVVVMLVIMF